METAKLYKEEMGFTYMDGELIKRYDMSVENKKLSNFGVGMYLYLDYFKSMSKVLFVMSLFMIVQVLFNLNSKQYQYSLDIDNKPQTF